MSPEQARGKAVDKRSDIWAYRCVLYEMLTGKRAFEDEDVSMTLSKVLQPEPDFETFPANVLPRVRQTIRMCLRKSSKERVADICDVRLALEGAFETAAAHATQDAVVAQPVWRRPLAVAAATAIVTGLAVGLVARSLWPTVEPLSPRAPTPTSRASPHRTARRSSSESADGRHQT
jgi:eukaryotic-like serine/threonine-protein kinase